MASPAKSVYSASSCHTVSMMLPSLHSMRASGLSVKRGPGYAGDGLNLAHELRNLLDGRPAFFAFHRGLRASIDRDAALGDEHVDDLSGAGHGRHCSRMMGNSLRNEGAVMIVQPAEAPGVAVAPDAVEEYAVRMRHHVDVKVDVDLGGSHQRDIEHVRDAAREWGP